MRISLFSKILLSLPLLAMSLIVFVNYLPLHSSSSETAGAPCLFEVVTRTECTGEAGNLNSAGYHFSALSDTFTAISGATDLLSILAVLMVGVVILMHLARNRYELYVRAIIKQKWKERQSLENLFDPIKSALRSGILKRKEEPSPVIV